MSNYVNQREEASGLVGIHRYFMSDGITSSRWGPIPQRLVFPELTGSVSALVSIARLTRVPDCPPGSID